MARESPADRHAEVQRQVHDEFAARGQAFGAASPASSTLRSSFHGCRQERHVVGSLRVEHQRAVLGADDARGGPREPPLVVLRLGVGRLFLDLADGDLAHVDGAPGRHGDGDRLRGRRLLHRRDQCFTVHASDPEEVRLPVRRIVNEPVHSPPTWPCSLICWMKPKPMAKTPGLRR
jgi:hypothetical protein